MQEAYVNLAYLVASALFVFGLKGLSHPRTAGRGNLMAATGMLIAVAVTLFDRDIVGYEVIAAGVVVGGVIGALLAVRIAMTAMPQLVALFNGFGGGASVLVSGAVLAAALRAGLPDLDFRVATAASGIIGGVTFWGSLVAFGKLQGLITESPGAIQGPPRRPGVARRDGPRPRRMARGRSLDYGHLLGRGRRGHRWSASCSCCL